jgi:hypothetical protein
MYARLLYCVYKRAARKDKFKQSIWRIGNKSTASAPLVVNYIAKRYIAGLAAGDMSLDRCKFRIANLDTIGG